VKKEDNKMAIGFCSRSKDIIEPFLKPQWFMNCDALAKQAVDAVDSGELKILPEFHKQTWHSFLDEDKIRQWCISRQLWWGHQIPAWKVEECAKGAAFLEGSQEGELWFCGENEKEAWQKAEKKLGKES
jgi:valyl-tRNA synthetase